MQDQILATDSSMQDQSYNFQIQTTTDFNDRVDLSDISLHFESALMSDKPCSDLIGFADDEES